MPRPCTICSDPNRSRLAAEGVTRGDTDTAIGDAIGVGRMAVRRHRLNHVEAPARALVAAAAKGRDAAEQRVQMMAAAEAGDPSAFITLTSIVADLRQVHERLERAAGAAEQGNQRLAVASLSAQQLRAAEVRARIGGVGGYAPQKAAATEGQTFCLNIIFGNGHQERIEALVPAPGVVLDGDATDSAR